MLERSAGASVSIATSVTHCKWEPRIGLKRCVTAWHCLPIVWASHRVSAFWIQRRLLHEHAVNAVYGLVRILPLSC